LYNLRHSHLRGNDALCNINKEFLMLTYPGINPVAFHIGSWPVYWYGLMYLFGFLISWGLLSLRIRSTQATIAFNQEQLTDILFYGALGIIIGGRLGYILFYDWQVIFSHPLAILETWKGGMSFHGGLLGVIIALWVYARKTGRSIFELTDFVAPVVPVGLALGRLGNFINGELWGRAATSPWAMIFPNAGPIPRHPSQLYELACEGIILFIILWTYSRRPRPLGAISGLFLFCYGLFRLFLEIFREPDAQIGFFWGMITEGQLLSLPMILFGIIFLTLALKKGAFKKKANS
jgi:phosphatidylglycerol---prolipoprotein diacylglyceryl transferase